METWQFARNTFQSVTATSYDMNYIRDGAAAPPEDVPPPVAPPVP